MTADQDPLSPDALQAGFARLLARAQNVLAPPRKNESPADVALLETRRAAEIVLLAGLIVEHPLVKLASATIAQHEVDPLRLARAIVALAEHQKLATELGLQAIAPALTNVANQLARIADATEAFADVDPIDTSFGPVDLNSGRGIASQAAAPLSLARLRDVLGIAAYDTAPEALEVPEP